MKHALCGMCWLVLYKKGFVGIMKFSPEPLHLLSHMPILFHEVTLVFAREVQSCSLSLQDAHLVFLIVSLPKYVAFIMRTGVTGSCE